MKSIIIVDFLGATERAGNKHRASFGQTSPRYNQWKNSSSFLSFPNFYRTLIQAFSKVTTSLTRLTSTNSPFAWTPWSLHGVSVVPSQRDAGSHKLNPCAYFSHLTEHLNQRVWASSVPNSGAGNGGPICPGSSTLLPWGLEVHSSSPDSLCSA